ncbi:MAG: Exodeoxyribonuclease 7 small subunit [Candidatus Saccharibacteria bacterium]|nr:Exodeoxyribonuclease 7 small subunit [Candidatus Saccharibacteria bacterium]
MPKKSEPTIDYQALSAELNEILTQLQSGVLDIDAAITKYERGSTIVKQLETYLKQAENKVKKVLKG